MSSSFSVCIFFFLFFFFLMIRRPPRSTQGVSSAASDVYKRQGIDIMGDRVIEGYTARVTKAHNQVCNLTTQCENLKQETEKLKRELERVDTEREKAERMSEKMKLRLMDKKVSSEEEFKKKKTGG
eukprot:TRINITY_DN6463_c0_g1_i2.p1 TRINITY_DN6463_c0_g1~~TRINITY_DN6463_c0_g1_i2.p1  ORF type:complete len:126 (-),score=43.58 TRINITY_DN6463_c0_g1_i2:74-451(-)